MSNATNRIIKAYDSSNIKKCLISPSYIDTKFDLTSLILTINFPIYKFNIDCEAWKSLLAQNFKSRYLTLSSQKFSSRRSFYEESIGRVIILVWMNFFAEIFPTRTYKEEIVDFSSVLNTTTFYKHYILNFTTFQQCLSYNVILFKYVFKASETKLLQLNRNQLLQIWQSFFFFRETRQTLQSQIAKLFFATYLFFQYLARTAM